MRTAEENGSDKNKRTKERRMIGSQEETGRWNKEEKGHETYKKERRRGRRDERDKVQ